MEAGGGQRAPVYIRARLSALVTESAGENDTPREKSIYLGGRNMPKATLAGVEIEVDEDGFIQEPERWTREMAEDIAKEESSTHPMSDEAWRLVDYIRNYFLDFEVAPPVRMVCKKTGFDLKKVYELFPKGPAAGTCKVAGLPKPTGCV